MHISKISLKRILSLIPIIRINSIADIPAFLKETITTKDNQINLVCVEGNETAPLDSVIGYEESTSTITVWNTWHIANAATNLVEIDGVFLQKINGYSCIGCF